jgi:hypothetical protein
MTKDFDYRLFVEIPATASLTISTILANPRQCLPGEMVSACENIQLRLEPSELPLPRESLEFATFVVKGFFSLAHRTGLYNRQKMVWRGIGRIVEIKITRPKSGWLRKVDEPYAEFTFFDSRSRCVIWACMLDWQATGRFSKEKGRKKFIAHCLKRVKKIQEKEEHLIGAFIGLPSPICKPVLAMISRLTGGTDPIRRYEALLPAPMNIACNLLETSIDPVSPHSLRIELISPRLKSPQNLVSIVGSYHADIESGGGLHQPL